MNEVKITSGSFKGRRIATPGGKTHPMGSRERIALFNMISEYLADSNFLDLFSGSGAIGIEALSRGAAHASFVEQSKKAMDCIRDNLKFTRLDDRAEVYETDVINALSRMEGKRVFDYIFMDPPYNQLHEKRVLEYLSNSTLLSADGIIIVEASLETDFSYVEEFGFKIIKEKEYKTNKHIFLEKEA